MDWIQEYNGVFTHGEIADRKTCYGVTCNGYSGCFVDQCLCYETFPCKMKAMPLK